MATATNAEKPNPPAAAVPVDAGTPAPDVENPPPPPSFLVTTVVRRWKREDLLVKTTLLLRALACFFSLISLIVMGSNKHGDWKDFDQYQEYKYCLAIAILAFLYSIAQVVCQMLRLSSGKDAISRRDPATILDFAGDQIMAYLLISALSAAIPITNRMREGADNMFTDASATAISMAFFTFLSLALSALISGFKFSNQTYI